MASKRAIYRALVDLASTLIERMVDNGLKTVWCANELTLVPEGTSGLFMLITYNSKTALAANLALTNAGLLLSKDLGAIGDPPAPERDYQDPPVVAQEDREAAAVALQEDSELVRAWIRTGVRKGLFNEDLERVATAIAYARAEGRRANG